MNEPSPTRRVNFVLGSTEYAALAAQAKELRISVGELIRRAVEDQLHVAKGKKKSPAR